MNRRTFFGAIAGAGVAAMVPVAKAGPALKVGDRISLTFTGTPVAPISAFDLGGDSFTRAILFNGSGDAVAFYTDGKWSA